MTASERLQYMTEVVLAKMRLHPEEDTFVRFNTKHLIALIDVAIAADKSASKTLPMVNALERLADT